MSDDLPVFSADRTREVAEALAMRTNDQHASLSVAMVNLMTIIGSLHSFLETLQMTPEQEHKTGILLTLLSVSCAQTADAAGLDRKEMKTLNQALYNDRKDALAELKRRGHA